jgi:hypothetical protein
MLQTYRKREYFASSYLPLNMSICKTDTALRLCGRVFQSIPLGTLYHRGVYTVQCTAFTTFRTLYQRLRKAPRKKQEGPQKNTEHASYSCLPGNLLDAEIIGLCSMSYIFFVSV